MDKIIKKIAIFFLSSLLIGYTVGCSTSVSSPEATTAGFAYVTKRADGTVSTDQVTVNKYKGLDVKCEKKQEASEEEVEEQLKNYLDSESIYETDMQSEIKEGDKVNIDYDGYIDGKSFDGGSASAYDLTIGSGSFIDDFEDQLIGHKAGDEVYVNVTFPDDYGEESIQGKDALFVVNINYIKIDADIPDELTDPFIVKYTDYGSLDEYKEYVKEQISSGYEDDFESAQQDAVTDALLENSEVVEYPQEDVDEIIEENNSYYEEYAEAQGVGFDELITQMGYESVDAYNEELETYAKNYVKFDLICSAVADAEGFSIDDGNYEEEALALAEEYGYSSVDEFEEAYSKSQIKKTLTCRKVLEFCVENANFTYTDAEEDTSADTEDASTGADDAGTEKNSTEVSNAEEK